MKNPKTHCISEFHCLFYFSDISHYLEDILTLLLKFRFLKERNSCSIMNERCTINQKEK